MCCSAPDQLRQRTAWALSQIFSVGAPNFQFDQATEPWAVYYDVFVQHAFGNYRDILQEVAASPVMGQYLTLLGNSALAYNGAQGLRHHLGLFLLYFSVPCHPSRAVRCALLGGQAYDGMLIGACDPMV